GLFAVLFAVFSGCMDQQAPIVKIAATESAPTPFAGATSAISISSGTQIKISWNASTDSALTGYRLYSVGEDGTLTILASPIPKSVTSYTHGGRTPGEAYRYLVRSLSGTKELDENMSIV